MRRRRELGERNEGDKNMTVEGVEKWSTRGEWVQK